MCVQIEVGDKVVLAHLAERTLPGLILAGYVEAAAVDVIQRPARRGSLGDLVREGHDFRPTACISIFP